MIKNTILLQYMRSVFFLTDDNIISFLLEFLDFWELEILSSMLSFNKNILI